VKKHAKNASLCEERPDAEGIRMGNGIEWDLSREKSFFSCAFFVDVTNETSWILVGFSGIGFNQPKW